MDCPCCNANLDWHNDTVVYCSSSHWFDVFPPAAVGDPMRLVLKKVAPDQCCDVGDEFKVRPDNAAVADGTASTIATIDAVIVALEEIAGLRPLASALELEQMAKSWKNRKLLAEALSRLVQNPEARKAMVDRSILQVLNHVQSRLKKSEPLRDDLAEAVFRLHETAVRCGLLPTDDVEDSAGNGGA